MAKSNHITDVGNRARANSSMDRHGPNVKNVVSRARPAAKPAVKIQATAGPGKLKGPGVTGCGG